MMERQLWVTMTTVINERLLTPEKRVALTEPKLAHYRETVESSGIYDDVDGVIDGECRRYLAIGEINRRP